MSRKSSDERDIAMKRFIKTRILYTPEIFVLRSTREYIKSLNTSSKV
jgi:hypothetical protein